MHGDFTRDTFDRGRHFSSVRHQQGRVQLDADFNEQADIALYLERTAVRDQIGGVGVPYADPSEFRHFQVRGAALADLELAPGRIYVDGVLVEHDAAIATRLDAQPHLPPDAPIVEDENGAVTGTLSSAQPGQYLVYLRIADRHVTAIEEPALRDVALGTVDTTTRVQTVWQARIRRTPGGLNCVSARNLLPAPSRARLTSSEKPVAGPDDPCAPGGGGGYLGLENQLYRVEVHAGGSLGTATLKWSRENGSVVVAVHDFIRETKAPNPSFKVVVPDLGRDEVLGLAEDDWVELLDDQIEQLGQVGTLARIVAVERGIDGGYIVELSAEVTSHIPSGDDPIAHRPRLRRWDQSRNLQPDGTVLTGAGPIELEDGVQIELAVEPADGPEFQTGDFWIFSARAATGTVERLAAAPPRGARRYALLALVDAADVFSIGDCRPKFPPATDLLHLLYVGGDGQQGPAGQTLSAPLQVSVALGSFPVPGASIQWTVTAGNGSVSASTLPTGADGVAACTWNLGTDLPLQVVEARLLRPDGSLAPHPPIRFSAAIAVPSEGGGGGCCVTVGLNGEFADLDTAFEKLLGSGVREICLCLTVGEHAWRGLKLERTLREPPLHIRITGCGPASLVHLTEPLLLTGITSFQMQALAIFVEFEANGPQGALAFDACGEVALEDCAIAGMTALEGVEPFGTLVSIAHTGTARLRDLRLEAWTRETFAPLRRGFETPQTQLLLRLLDAIEAGGVPFAEVAMQVGEELATQNPDERKALANRVVRLLRGGQFSDQEQFTIQKLGLSLSTPDRPAEDFSAILLDLRRAAIKGRPGTALVLGALPEGEDLGRVRFGQLDHDNLIGVESCKIAGIVGLYGLPVSPDFFNERMNADMLGRLQGQFRDGPLRMGEHVPLGTLEMRGNQLVRLGIPARLVETFMAIFQDPGLKAFFRELLLTDNVFEGAQSVAAAMHCGLSGNQFLARSGQKRGMIAILVGDSAVYLGNRGQDQPIMDISRLPGPNANAAANALLPII